MILNQHYGAHSAAVDMRLIVDGTTLSITHMGGDFLILESSIDHPPTEATIVLKIDESERRWTVRLPEGLRRGQERISVLK
jgi:hypothetical protein